MTTLQQLLSQLEAKGAPRECACSKFCLPHEYVPMIEREVYEQLKRERDSLKAQIEKLLGPERGVEIRRALEAVGELEAERERAEAERAALLTENKAECRLTYEMQKQRDDALEQLRWSLQKEAQLKEQLFTQREFDKAQFEAANARIEELERTEKVYYMNREWIAAAKERIERLEGAAKEVIHWARNAHMMAGPFKALYKALGETQTLDAASPGEAE